MENVARFGDFEGKEPQYRYHEDGFRIRDVAANRIISIPLLNHYYAIAYVWNDRVYVVACDYENQRCRIRHTILICSDDLITWSRPEIIMKADGNEHFFNYALCRAHGKFCLLYETDDRRWSAFTMRFCESDDLATWWKLPENYIYGTDKYTGGPALYYDEQDDLFYILYVNSLPLPDGRHMYNTRIARSADLITWQEAPANRPVVSPDLQRSVNEAKCPGIKECSASDLEMCEFNGKTYVYWVNGNQHGTCAGWESVCNQPMKELLRTFFE